MPHATPLIATIVAGLCIAFVFGAIANRFKIPPLAGYLLAGIVVGPFTPGYVADQHVAPELAEIGVILLMFGVGLHFSLKDLLSVKRIAVPGALVQIGFATLLGWIVARLFGWSTGAGIVFGLSLSVASTVVLLRALQDFRILDSEKGRIAVGWLIVEDLVMVLALVLLPPLAGLLGGDSGTGETMSTGALLWTLVGTLAKVAAFIAVMLVVGRRVIPWVLSQIVKTGSKELFTLGVLAIALGVAFGSALIFGVSFALGAFFAGMILGESEMSHDAAEDILPLRDAFSVLFFVSVGMLFDYHVLIQAPFAVLVTFLIIVVGKSVAAWVIVKLFKRSNDTALTIAASLAQIGEFSFILAGLGVSLKLLPELGRDLVLAGAILSIILNPLVFYVARRMARPLRDAEPHAMPAGAAFQGRSDVGFDASAAEGDRHDHRDHRDHQDSERGAAPLPMRDTPDVVISALGPVDVSAMGDDAMTGDGMTTAAGARAGSRHTAASGAAPSRTSSTASSREAVALGEEMAARFYASGQSSAGGIDAEEGVSYEGYAGTDADRPPAAGVIVVGYGRVGREVVRTLSAQGRDFIVIDDRPDMHTRLRAAGVRSLCGNAVLTDILTEAGIAHASHLIVAIPNAFEAAQVVKHAQQLAPRTRILARANSTAEAQHLEAHGAHRVVLGQCEIARGMTDQLAADMGALYDPNKPAGRAGDGDEGAAPAAVS